MQRATVGRHGEHNVDSMGKLELSPERPDAALMSPQDHAIKPEPERANLRDAHQPTL
jgi:hypothetical protein